MNIKKTLFSRVEFIWYSVAVSLLIGLAACGGGSGGDRAGILGFLPSLSLLAGNTDGVGSADGDGAAARFFKPNGIATDSLGNIYVAERDNCIIRKITPGGVVSTIAGLANYPGSQDGKGSDARFNSPRAIVVDSKFNVYVADSANNKIRKITPDGVVTTLAGSGAAGNVNGVGNQASFNHPVGVAIDSADNVYVSDTFSHLIRVISTTGPTVGNVTTFAGLGYASNTDATGTLAGFNGPHGLVFGAAGKLYVADTFNNLIRVVSTTGSTVGVVSTLAGSGTPGNLDETGKLAGFNRPHGVAIDSAGNLYVGDVSNNLIRVVSTTGSASAIGTVTTLAGSGAASNVDATGKLAGFNFPHGVAVHSGNVYVADANNHAIRKIDSNGSVTTFAGKSSSIGSEDGSGSSARFSGLSDVAVDSFGNLYAVDRDNYTIRKITPAGLVTTFAGASGVQAATDGQGTNIRFRSPSAVAIDRNNILYVADDAALNTGTIRVIPTTGPNAGVSSTIAAALYSPSGIAVDTVGNIYVADLNNHSIRKRTPDGTLSVFAGSTGASGNADGKGTAARFSSPSGVATDSVGNVFVADQGNHTIRRISTDGQVTTLAGLAGERGNADGGGLARFNSPRNVVVSADGNVYVADTLNHTIRKITPDGVVSTVVGLAGKGGFVAGGLPGTIVYPQGMALQGRTLYFTSNNGVAVVKNLP